MHEWIKKTWYVYLMKYYLASKKEGNLVTRNNMDEPGGHYVRWYKSGTKRIHRLHLYMESGNVEHRSRVKWWFQEMDLACRDVGQRVTLFWLGRISAGDSLCSMVTVVNNNVLYL
jgi:hypothetical protein